MSGPLGIPLCVLTDSYKITHPFQYPEAQKMVAYGEFRRGFEKDTTDTRILVFGIRYIIKQYLEKQWTQEDLESIKIFFKGHSQGGFPFPLDLFQKIVTEHNGYIPVRIEALPEGTICHPHVPVYIITAMGEFSRLVTFLETLMTMVWYPSTVATLSRRIKDIIEEAFSKSVDEENYDLIDSRLHDFGFRGCTCVEQSVIGGCAHLLNFTGTDTLSAAYYAQMVLNNGKPVGQSIPATEHSVMTSYNSEREAMLRMIDQFGNGVYSIVMDSYDYANALDVVLPSVAKEKVGKGGFMVLRPDSGDPCTVVMMALKAAEKVFGIRTNSKGYKVLNGCSVIQGDGISVDEIKKILTQVLYNGFSAQNVAFGMGGGLLQKVNRDTMSFATKLCHIVDEDGTKRDVMKYPKTDMSKASLPGELAVILDNAIPTVIPKELLGAKSSILEIVYDKGPVKPSEKKLFETLKATIQAKWKTVPKVFNPLSPELERKRENLCKR